MADKKQAVEGTIETIARKLVNSVEDRTTVVLTQINTNLNCN